MDVLVIDRTTMQVGGIETYFANLMEYAISTGRRVVWLTTPAHAAASCFSVTSSPAIEIVFIRRTPLGPVYPSIEVSADDDVIMLTTDPCRYVLSDKYRETACCRTFTHLLVLPHYTGAGYYPETIFKNALIRDYWHNKIRLMASSLINANCVRGFNIAHLDAYERAYSISMHDKDNMVLRSVVDIPTISRGEIISRERTRSSRFEIITCARFDFPHKGYLLGLIRAFEQIHRDHPCTRLVVVGYGPGQADVDEVIRGLSSDAASCLELTGQLAPEELLARYRSAHLNVGLAGALSKGAMCALPSIKMAHYTYECEGFGFIEESSGLVPDVPASNMVGLIESVVTMSADEYVKHAFAAYETVAQLVRADPEYLFRQKSQIGSCDLGISRTQMRVLFGTRLFLQKALGRSLFENAKSERGATDAS